MHCFREAIRLYVGMIILINEILFQFRLKLMPGSREDGNYENNRKRLPFGRRRLAKGDAALTANFSHQE